MPKCNLQRHLNFWEMQRKPTHFGADFLDASQSHTKEDAFVAFLILQKSKNGQERQKWIHITEKVFKIAKKSEKKRKCAQFLFSS